MSFHIPRQKIAGCMSADWPNLSSAASALCGGSLLSLLQQSYKWRGVYHWHQSPNVLDLQSSYLATYEGFFFSDCVLGGNFIICCWLYVQLSVSMKTEHHPWSLRVSRWKDVIGLILSADSRTAVLFSSCFLFSCWMLQRGGYVCF